MMYINKLCVTEKCVNCKHYYYDGRYSDDWCMIDNCLNEPDIDCLFCQKCPFFEKCVLDYEIEKMNKGE